MVLDEPLLNFTFIYYILFGKLDLVPHNRTVYYVNNNNNSALSTRIQDVGGWSELTMIFGGIVLD